MVEVHFEKKAIRFLGEMPPKQAKAVRVKIDRIAGALDEASMNDVMSRHDVDIAKLTGRSGYRLRVGKWRAIFQVEADGLKVIAIGPRGGVYKE